MQYFSMMLSMVVLRHPVVYLSGTMIRDAVGALSVFENFQLEILVAVFGPFIQADSDVTLRCAGVHFCI